MAVIKTSDSDVQLFTVDDFYRYETDNRPLRILIANDQAMNTELEAVRDEVAQARSGIYQTYATLDARLDDLEIGAGLPLKQILFSEFMARADAQHARYASGFVSPVTEIFRLSELTADGTFGASGSSFADYGAASFGQLFLRDDSSAQALRVVLGTGFGLNLNGSVYTFDRSSPVPLFLRGMQVKLFNEAGGNASTGAVNDVTWNLPAAPAAGSRVDLLWLEVWVQNVSRSSPTFYPYGAVGSLASALNTPEDASLAGTVGFHGGNGGDYFQLQHRLRVTAGVNPELNQFGMSDALVLARGGSNSPQAGYTFTNGTKGAMAALRDPGIWVAGAGDGTSKTALNTLDGYVYALPVALVFRRNTAQWTHSNQNGTKTSAGTGTWATADSARPDGYYHDKIERDDIVPIAPSCVTGKHDLKRILDESFDRLLRGTLRTRHGYLRYDDQYAEGNYDSAAEPVAGPIVNALNAISASVVSKSDQFLDGGGQKSSPDDFRRIFGAQPEAEPIGFSLNLQSSTYTPANLVSFGTGTITIKGIGNSVGDVNAVIDEAPLLWWSGSNQPVALTGGTWSGLGTGTITAALNTGDVNYNAAGTIIGFVKITFGGTSGGYKKPNLSTVGQTYVDPLLAETPFVGLGIVGSDRLLSPAGVAVTATSIYISDVLAHKVWKLNATTYAVEASFGTYGVSGATNSTLNQPTQLTVDGSGNVFVCDTMNHRLVKLNSSLAYVGQFGVTSTSGADNSHLNKPRGVAVDGSGNLYVADTLNYRVVKLASNLTYTDQFGVTGVSVADATHCFSPKGITLGTDSKLYVADTVRIIVLDLDLTPYGFLEPGVGLPTTRANSVYGIRPNTTMSIKADASGNKYVLGWFSTAGQTGAPSGAAGVCLTKYASDWSFVARYGARFDANGIHGGLNAGTVNGLCYVQGWAIDTTNASLILIENNYIGTGANPDGSVPSTEQARVVVLNMSDLTLKYPVKYSAYTGGAAKVYGPIVGNRPNSGLPTSISPYGINWPVWLIGAMDFDSTNRYAYVVCASGASRTTGTTGSWARVEKWAAPTDDPDTWSFVANWGTLVLDYVNGAWAYKAWMSSSHDSTRMRYVSGQDMGMAMLQDGTALFLTDNHTVIKLNSSGSGLSYVGRFGVTGVPGNDTAHLNFRDIGNASIQQLAGGVQVCGASGVDSTARVYVADVANSRMVILKANSGWNTSGSPTAWSTTFSNAHTIQAIWYPQGNSVDGNTLWMRTWDDPTHESWELDVTSRDAPAYVDPGVGATVTVFIPCQTSGLPAGVSNNIMGTAVADGILYWVDYGTNQLVAVNLADYRFLGECGTAGLGGADKANLNGPAHIAAYGKKIYVAEYRGSRVFSSHRVFAHVQQRIGRVEFLLPPEQGSKWFGYSKHAAYQGVILRGKPTRTFDPNGASASYQYPPLTGRAVLTQPERVLVTTLGRGSVEFLQNPGVTAYANCIGMLPVPPSTPDEKDVSPKDFSLQGGVLTGRAHYFLPVFTIESASHGQFPGENESFWERKTTLSNSWGGNGFGLRGGVRSLFGATSAAIARPITPLFPAVSAIGCDDTPAYRYLVTPFLVVIEGEILLAIRVEGAASNQSANTVGMTTNDVIELFRPIGHPMLKDNGEADAVVTRS